MTIEGGNFKCKAYFQNRDRRVCVRACVRACVVRARTCVRADGSHKKHGTLKCNDYFVILLDGVDATVTPVTRHSLAIINHYER